MTNPTVNPAPIPTLPRRVVGNSDNDLTILCALLKCIEITEQIQDREILPDYWRQQARRSVNAWTDSFYLNP